MKKLILLLIYLFFKEIVIYSADLSDDEYYKSSESELAEIIIEEEISAEALFNKLKNIYASKNISELVDEEILKFIFNKKVKINLTKLKSDILKEFADDESILNFCSLLCTNILTKKDNPKIKDFLEIVTKKNLNHSDIFSLHNFLRDIIQENLLLKKDEILETSRKCCNCVIQ